MKKKKRIIIDNSVIRKLTGTGRRQATRILNAIRKFKRKNRLQPITTYDVADFFGLPEPEVRKETEEDEG